jgi:hypothetical protein
VQTSQLNGAASERAIQERAKKLKGEGLSQPAVLKRMAEEGFAAWNDRVLRHVAIGLGEPKLNAANWVAQVRNNGWVPVRAESEHKPGGVKISVRAAASVARPPHEAVRLALLAGGYDPVPVKGKWPNFTMWQTLRGSTRETVISWTHKHWDHRSAGVLCRHTPAFDVDIKDAAAAEAVEKLVRDRYSDCGVVLSRVGKAPKRLVPFRTDQPFKKFTAELVAPGPGGEIHRLEFLGDGQQFVVDGIHPDTRKPYWWFGGDLAAVGRDKLPRIDEAGAQQLMDDATELLVAEHGYKLTEKSQPRRKEQQPPKTAASEVGPRERAYAEAALRGRVAELAAMHEGEGRNDALLKAATRLGTMIAASWIDAAPVEDALAEAALATGLGWMGERSWAHARKTIKNGFRYGAQYAAPSLEDADAAAEAAMVHAAQFNYDDVFHDAQAKADDYDRGAEEKATDNPPNNEEKAGNGQGKGPCDEQPKPYSHDHGAGAGKDSAQPKAARRLIKTSAEFVASLKAPDYLIKGVLQRRFIYSMMAPTGAGKTCIAMRVAAHVAFGLPLLGRPVKQGRVLFLAGENPDDVCMRWIKLAEDMRVDVNTDRIIWLGARLPLSNRAIRKQIDAEISALGQVALVVVDTSAAFFEGDEENSNVQLGNHARMLRTFVDAPGGPTVLVTSHPVKSPDLENLVPRGGGAFVNEVDGNLVCVAQGGGLVDLHWHVKFRGPDFAPIPFKITAGQSEKLKDSDGEKIWTVTAAPVTAAEQEAAMDTAQRRRDELIVAMQGEPGGSMVQLADAAGSAHGGGGAEQVDGPARPEGAQGPRLGKARRAVRGC